MNEQLENGLKRGDLAIYSDGGRCLAVRLRRISDDLSGGNVEYFELETGAVGIAFGCRFDTVAAGTAHIKRQIKSLSSQLALLANG